MAVKSREDALFSAYLNNYKNAQAQAVTNDVQATQAARQKGAAILNATDKTLPSLGDTYGSTLQNIVSGAKMENSLNSDLLNRNLSLAKAQYNYASDMHTQMTAAKKYADEQAEKARKEAEEAAAKAQKEAERQAAAAAKAATKSSRRSSGRGSTGTTTNADSYDTMAASAGALKSNAATNANAQKDIQTKQIKGKDTDATRRSNAERNASARARYDGSEQEKSDIKYRAQQKAAATQKMLAEKQRVTPRTSTPAGQTNRSAKNKTATTPQTVRAGNLQDTSYNAQNRGISASVNGYAATAQAPTETEHRAAVQRKQQTAAALKKLQTDAGYRAELAAPGRKLTTAEINAVNQYSDPLWSVKQYAKGDMSANELNQEARERSSLQSKAQFNGLGQSAQAFTAGLYGAFPFTTKASDKLAETANSIYPDKEIPVLSKTLDETKSYDPLAAFAGNMAGQSMKYKLFNTAVEGTKYADAAQKAGSKLYDAAKNIPVLKDIVQPGFGEAAGRVLADTGADLALDTLPTLADDLSTYRDQQQAIANGDTVDDALTPGRIAGNTAKNIAGNVAMNALPEIGGAVISGIKNSFSGATLDESLQDAVNAASKNSASDTLPDLPHKDAISPVDLGKNADAFLQNVPAGGADAAKNVPDSAVTNFTPTSQNAAQSLTDAAADIPGGAVRERGFAESLRTNSDLPDTVKQDFVATPEVYNKLTNVETKARADAVMAKGQGEAVTAYQNMLSQRDPAAVPLGYELAKQYIADGDSDSAVELLRGMSKELTASGQFSQAAAISLMQNDPMTALRYAQRSIDDLNASGAKEMGRRWKDFKLTDTEIKAFESIPAGDSEAISAAMENVGKRIAKEYPVSMLSKWAEGRRLMFLLNPRTQIRNIASNVVQMPVTGVSDKVSAALQSLYAKTGTSSDFVQTKALHVDKTSKDIAEQVWNQVKDTIDGSSSYEQPISDAVKNAEVFKMGEGQQHNVLANLPGVKQGAQALEAISQKFTGKNVFEQMSSEKSVLENIRQFTYGLLELGDAPFVKKSFTDSLANIAAANKITSTDQITADMIAQATQGAMRTTYKDDNVWTQLFSSIHKLPGVGEAIMPFTQTPANMIARSLDYSPVGLAKGVRDFYTKGGNPAEYIDEIAKGLTGSAGMALGAALYKSGVLTGAESDNANKKAFDKQNGFLPFAIHVPDTNVYYRISDFQPGMMSVITGAAWAQTASGDATPAQAAKGAVIAFTNTLADNTNLANVGDLFGNYDGLGGGLWDAALGLPQSMVPALSGAIAKSTDTTVRNPYDATDPIQSQKNQIMAKIPGLSQELPAAYDTWGNEKHRDNAAFEQFLDPAAFTNTTTSSRDKEIQRLYEATGDIGVYPPSVKNGTEVDGLKLNNEQTSTYQRAAGQLNRQIVDEVMRSDEYRQADDATRVKMLKSAYEIGKEAGKEAANPDYVSENSDYLAYKANGIHDALLTSSIGAVLDKARDEKRTATGNADANLNKAERWQAIPSLNTYDDMVNAYLLNGSDDTAQELYDKAGAEATAAYLDIYTATKGDEEDSGVTQLEKLQTALPVLEKYDLNANQQMDVASMFLQEESPALRVQEQYGSDLALKYLSTYTQADADGNGKVSDTEFKKALLQAPGLTDEDIGKIYLSSKTTDDSTDEKAQTFNATYGAAGVADYLYLQYLERAYHKAEANRKIASGEGGNPDGSFNKSDLVNALNYMDLTREERRAYFSIIASTWKNPY